MKGNLSLVAFTLLTQSGIGLAVATMVFDGPGHLYQPAWFCSLSLVALGLAVVSLHLGSPFMAYRAVCNLRSSWLSRECLFLGGFFAVGVAIPSSGFLMRWGLSPSYVGWIWVSIGMVGLFSMASIYGRTAMPAWGMVHTHTTFFAATAVLGTALFLILATLIRPLPSARPAAFLVAGAVLLQAMDGLLHRHTPRPDVHILRVRAMGLACSLAGGVGLLLLAMKLPWTASPWVHASVLCLAIGQSLFRYAYFAGGVHALKGGWANIAYQPGQRLTRPSRSSGSWVELWR